MELCLAILGTGRCLRDDDVNCITLVSAGFIRLDEGLSGNNTPDDDEEEYLDRMQSKRLWQLLLTIEWMLS